MARRILLNIEEKILRSAVEIGAAEGVENVTGRKIALRCGISDATVFVYFGTKENLLAKTYEHVCDWINKTIETFTLSSKNCQLFEENWNALFAWLIKNIDYMEFFSGYRYSGRKVPQPKDRSNCLRLCRALVTNEGLKSEMSEGDYLVLWEGIVEGIVYYVTQAAQGKIENAPSKYRLVQRFLFEGLTACSGD